MRDTLYKHLLVVNLINMSTPNVFEINAFYYVLPVKEENAIIGKI
jgi:hypothetical protein